VAVPQRAIAASDAAPFRVREARRGDGDAIARLLGDLGYPGAADPSTVNWVISHPEMIILVAADPQDRPIGMLSLSHRPQLRMKGRIATIDELVVAEPWRRRGVGRALLARAVERAKALTCRRLELATHRSRGEFVRSFYSACGFEEANATVLRHVGLDFQKH
jgi:GNAT superfamily N-acetyltransferase